MKQSWECHRCHRVNAPHVDSCGCVSVAPYNPLVSPVIVPVPTWWERPYEITWGASVLTTGGGASTMVTQ